MYLVLQEEYLIKLYMVSYHRKDGVFERNHRIAKLQNSQSVASSSGAFYLHFLAKNCHKNANAQGDLPTAYLHATGSCSPPLVIPSYPNIIKSGFSIRRFLFVSTMCMNDEGYYSCVIININHRIFDLECVNDDRIFQALTDIIV